MAGVIEEIEKYILWLDQNSKSTDLTAISITIGKMSTQCFYFTKIVSDAYDTQNRLEDDFKEQKALFIKNYEGGVTKANAIVDSEPRVREAKRNWTEANNVYMRLKNYAHQFETILDCKRQFISVEKSLNVKGI